MDELPPEPTPEPVVVNDDTMPGLVRAVRRRIDASQRELANKIGVAQTTISRIEAGTKLPSLAMLFRILAADNLVLVVTDADGNVVLPMKVWDDTRDGGERQFPAHLDLILDPASRDWWGSAYGLARPPETYHRSRAYRDAMRERSQWEVRVAQLRNVPPPRDIQNEIRQLLRLRRELGRGQN